MAPRERSIDEAFEDLEKLSIHVQRLHDRLDSLPFVRADLHNEQINNLRSDISGVRTMQMWVLGLLGSILIAAIVAFITAVAQGRVV